MLKSESLKIKQLGVHEAEEVDDENTHQIMIIWLQLILDIQNELFAKWKELLIQATETKHFSFLLGYSLLFSGHFCTWTNSARKKQKFVLSFASFLIALRCRPSV